MEIKTKYSIGDDVYFYNEKICKISKGIISVMNLSIHNNVIEASYCIDEPQKRDFEVDEYVEKLMPLFRTHFGVHESLVFKDRDEAFEFAFKITEGL